MTTAALIYNPRAGKVFRRPELVPEIVRELGASYDEIRVVPTTGPHTAGSLARQAATDGAGVVVVLGGDGTINEAAQALSGMNVPLGILPGGTACVLANELGLGNDPVRAARALAGARPRKIAIGRLGFADGASRSFLLMAGVGFDAHIVHGLNLGLKDRVGKLAYWIGAMREIGRGLEEFDVEADGVLRRGSFALVSRTRNYGGDVTIARGASILSDDFEVVLLGGRSVLRYLWYFTAILLRLERMVGGITIFKAHRLRVSSMRGEHVHIQVDGEYAGEAPVTIEIVPDAIPLLIPAAFRG